MCPFSEPRAARHCARGPGLPSVAWRLPRALLLLGPDKRACAHGIRRCGEEGQGQDRAVLYGPVGAQGGQGDAREWYVVVFPVYTQALTHAHARTRIRDGFAHIRKSIIPLPPFPSHLPRLTASLRLASQRPRAELHVTYKPSTYIHTHI